MKDFSDLYKIDLETLAELDRMGEKSAQNLLDQIAASKKEHAGAADLRDRNPIRGRTDRPASRGAFWRDERAG